jgi:hypothetical protein
VTATLVVCRKSSLDDETYFAGLGVRAMTVEWQLSERATDHVAVTTAARANVVSWNRRSSESHSRGMLTAVVTKSMLIVTVVHWTSQNRGPRGVR